MDEKASPTTALSEMNYSKIEVLPPESLEKQQRPLISDMEKDSKEHGLKLMSSDCGKKDVENRLVTTEAIYLDDIEEGEDWEELTRALLRSAAVPEMKVLEEEIQKAYMCIYDATVNENTRKDLIIATDGKLVSSFSAASPAFVNGVERIRTTGISTSDVLRDLDEADSLSFLNLMNAGHVNWSCGNTSKISLSGRLMKGIQRGKITWDDGSLSEIVIESAQSLPSSEAVYKEAVVVGDGPVWSAWSTSDSGSDELFSADSPPSIVEGATGLVLIEPQEVRGMPLVNLSNDFGGQSLFQNHLIADLDGSKTANGEPRRKRGRPLGRPRIVSSQVAPITQASGIQRNYMFALRPSVPQREIKIISEPLPQKRKSTVPRKVKEHWLSNSTELMEDPMVMKEGTNEPAVCRRCSLSFAGRDHFDRHHNGLLTDEQISFSIKEKRARWNGIIKKRLKLRCQNGNCQKIVNSSTAMSYHEQTCGVVVEKQECPQCRHLIAKSYLHQHMMNHNRQAGVYTRPRKKCTKVSSPLLPVVQPGSSKRKRADDA